MSFVDDDARRRWRPLSSFSAVQIFACGCETKLIFGRKRRMFLMNADIKIQWNIHWIREILVRCNATAHPPTHSNRLVAYATRNRIRHRENIIHFKLLDSISKVWSQKNTEISSLSPSQPARGWTCQCHCRFLRRCRWRRRQRVTLFIRRRSHFCCWHTPSAQPPFSLAGVVRSTTMGKYFHLNFATRVFRCV